MHHDVTPGMVQSIKNGESLCWKGFLELSKDSLNLNEEGEKAYILNEIVSFLVILFFPPDFTCLFKRCYGFW